MGIRTQQMDDINRGGRAVGVVGLPDNHTSPDVDRDGMLDRDTHWSLMLTVSWDSGGGAMIATNLQYADGKKAKTAYILNRDNAISRTGCYAEADRIHVALLAPGYKEVARMDIK